MHAYIHTNMHTDIIMTHSQVATHANILRNLALHALIIQYDHHIEASYRTIGNY